MALLLGEIIIDAIGKRPKCSLTNWGYVCERCHPRDGLGHLRLEEDVGWEDPLPWRMVPSPQLPLGYTLPEESWLSWLSHHFLPGSLPCSLK